MSLYCLSGLGKTIQVIAFLAHLKVRNPEQKHLIIVP
jgi:SNF2 family DNA or RNA helicase